MGIMGFISQQKEKFRSQRIRVAEDTALKDLEKLDKARQERIALQKKADISNALKEEKKQIRDLKTEKLRKGLAKAKKGFSTLKKEFKKRQGNSSVYGNPFSSGPSQQVNSPFSLSVSKPEQKKSKDVVIRIQR